MAVTKKKAAPKQEWVSHQRMSNITITVLNKLEMWGVLVTPHGFSIRRILGGFMYEYDDGGKVFVSTDELAHE